MLESRKHVFWQALFLTVFFFLLGLVFGVYFEQLRSDDFNVAFYESEVSLYDSLALSQLLDSGQVTCEEVKISVLGFADKIYEEARELERFDEKSQLTVSVKTVHRKYDLLRTLLWISVINSKERCPEINSVVYLYVYDTQDVNLKAEQLVLSRILRDLKDLEGDNIVLIPIASDSNLATLDSLKREFNLQRYPAIIVNEKDVIYSAGSVSDIQRYLN